MAQQNNNNIKKVNDIEKKVVMTKRINKTTKGGRKGRFSALVIAGDKKGRVGYGLGKSVEVSVATKKATDEAKKNLKYVPIKPNGGLYHDIEANSGAVKLLIKTSPVGSGIVAGGVVRVILSLAGYKDACCKLIGSSNPINVAKTTIEALQKIKTHKEIAKIRFGSVGKAASEDKMENLLNKLYHGGYKKQQVQENITINDVIKKGEEK
ncbi:MAG: 30S ribosomal protein S5 [Mycoplasmataceae bacterium]|jgi:small subunit ribosomal protein S5|nr:30S ribosomal protein S5 [Mycoplasmataceae bacterium]